MRPTKFAWLTLATIGLVWLVGCEALYEKKPEPQQTPTPIVAVDAAECLRVYGGRVADAFERSADQFDQHASSSVIVNEMGDALKPARIESFLPLMRKLNELRPPDGASDEQRAGADLARAKVLREWAGQLRARK